jgi:hypothetical protein
MAWRYPRYDIKSGYVIDIDVVNDNFLPIVEEASGALNEHNFSTDTPTLSRSQLAEDSAFILHKAESVGVSPTSYTSKSGWAPIASADGWQTFSQSGLSLDFVAKGGTTWICASLQLIAGTNATRIDQKGFGYNVGLRVDGVTLYDSVLGSGDASNEFYRGYKGRGLIIEPSSKNELSGPQCGGGISGARLPVSVDTVVELSPGRHLIEVVVMNIRASMESSSSDSNTYIGPREIFALEMLR